MTHHDKHSASEAGTFRIGGDLSVNRIGYGAMRLTGSGVWGDPDDREGAKKVLHKALELGVNFIDTADAYGPETNENLIREALYPYPQNVLVATKGGHVRDKDKNWLTNGRPEHIKEACEASMKRLGVEQIELYQFHRPDPDVPYEESIGALAELKSEGKVRHVGISNVDVGQFEAARSIVPISSVQNRYNVNERGADDLVDACERANVAFLPYFPLATGDLAKPGGPLDEIAERHDATAGQVALAWLLHRSPVIIPIPGTSSVDHLEENVAAGSISLGMSEMRTLSAA
ncbi:MAG: aldo/keto reductase [Rubrobacter sp.]|nr:aldo/keto reductase [Rubrobacter sp.]